MGNLIYQIGFRWQVFLQRYPGVQDLLWAIGGMLSFIFTVALYGTLVVVAYVAYGALSGLTWWMMPAVFLTVTVVFFVPKILLSHRE